MTYIDINGVKWYVVETHYRWGYSLPEGSESAIQIMVEGHKTLAVRIGYLFVMNRNNPRALDAVMTKEALKRNKSLEYATFIA